mgnify:CR=1 FL=1
MRTIVIRENTELPVDDELASAINKMLAEDSTLPIKIKDHTVSFADYTVGSLQVGEVNIEIKPRNPVFTLETLFEMLLFESLNNFDENYLSSGFGDNQSFGIAAITSQFYYECVKLVDFGLTGGFTSEKKYGNEITGPLVLSEYHPAYIPIRGVAYIVDVNLDDPKLKLSDFEMSRIRHHFESDEIRVQHDNSKYDPNTKKGKYGVYSYLKPDKTLRFHIGDPAKTQIQEAYYCSLDSVAPAIIVAREPKLWDIGRRLSVDECRKLQGFPDGFIMDQSEIQAKKQMGNSVAVPVIEAIAKAMLEAYEKGEQHN